MSSFIAIHRPDGGSARIVPDANDAARALRSGTGLTWLHFANVTREDVPLLEAELGLHPLAVEDCLNPSYQRPKIDDYDDYLFAVLHGINYEQTDEAVSTDELNLFVGRTWVVSATLHPLGSVQHLVDQLLAEPDSLSESAALVAYTLIDALVDGFAPTVDRMIEVTDLIEDEALANPNPALLQHLIRLKRSVIRLARVAAPQRDLIGAVSRGQYALLADDAGMFFRDVYDHLVRIEDLTESLRDRADHAVSTYHSALSIRQNETMRVLSVVASIFLPLTLLAGVYGMNFEHMPELGWEYSYFVVLGFMLVVIAIGTYLLFGRAMLGWGRDRIGNLASFALEPPVIGDALREASRLRTRVMQAPKRRREP